VANGWTPERKAKQQAGIHRWQPWKKSTGPRTALGKQTVALNALKHGARSRAFRGERNALRDLIAAQSGHASA
jgi:hypothetical protein